VSPRSLYNIEIILFRLDKELIRELPSAKWFFRTTASLAEKGRPSDWLSQQLELGCDRDTQPKRLGNEARQCPSTRLACLFETETLHG
jgi:hypothetical protein